MTSMNVECPAAHGWLPDDQVDWSDAAYPAVVEQLLVEVSDNDCSLGLDVENDSEYESSSEENFTYS